MKERIGEAVTPSDAVKTGKRYFLTKRDRWIDGQLTGPSYIGRVLSIGGGMAKVQTECMGRTPRSVVLAHEDWPIGEIDVEELE